MGTEDDKKEGGDDLERSSWGSQLDFFMSCVGYAVGLGNIWRFPYLCYKNGGGAFLIPYVLMLILCGLPLFFLELAFGQFASIGPITIWRISPFFRGIGFGMVLISLMVCLYYNVIITYGLYYLFVSLTSMDDPLPWSACNNAWNTKYCITERADMSNMTDAEKVNTTLQYFNHTCVDSWLSESNLDTSLLTYNMTQTNLSHCDESSLYKLPSDEYYTRNVLRLHEAEDFGDLGGISLKLIVLLGLSWIILFLCLLKGVETDAIVVAFINCATSIFAGFVIFSMLGYMAHATNQAVANVTEDVDRFGYEHRDRRKARSRVSRRSLRLESETSTATPCGKQFAMFETVISAIVDEFPNFLRRRRTVFGLLCHLVGFLLGIPMTTKGGIWVLTLLNDYSASYSLMVVCLCELIAINYVYGNKRFCLDIKMMLGFEPNIYWRATWMVITPLSILVMIVMSGVQYAPAGLGDYKFEPWVQGVGFAIAALPVGCILVGFLVQFIRYKSIREATRPDPKWGPAKEEYRTGRYAAVNLAFVGDN
ncbi:hypothetical protein BaRGS_00023154, partial [Batillaria attramentaria]